MTETTKGKWEIKGMEGKLPMVYSLRAVKPWLPAAEWELQETVLIPDRLFFIYSGEEIKALIQDIYARVYKKGSNDADLQSFIHLIPERIELTTVWK